MYLTGRYIVFSNFCNYVKSLKGSQRKRQRQTFQLAHADKFGYKFDTIQVLWIVD